MMSDSAFRKHKDQYTGRRARMESIPPCWNTSAPSSGINDGKSDGGDQSETILILASVWFAFFIGAVSGGLAAAHYGLRCIIAPAIVLFVLGLLCWLIEAEKT
jgi:MFS family permease